METRVTATPAPRNLEPEPVRASAWSPLRQPLFRALWLAAIVSNIGTWMQNVGGAWLMTSLTPSPVMVALMQTATSLPVFLLGLPAGALADLVDRRRLLLVAQGWMALVAAVLGLLTVFGLTTPWVLITATLALGVGGALNGPAWQALMPALVPRRDLPAAVALNGAVVNLARAVGPALAGALVAAAGAGATFLLNAVSFCATIIVIARWRPAPVQRGELPEQLLGAMRAGLRYARFAPELRAVLVRVALFVGGASALWALLPAVARRELGLEATGYGVLLGSLGVGAVLGVFALPSLRRWASVDVRVGVATLAFALVTLVLGDVAAPLLVAPALLIGGFAWIMAMTSFSVAAQTRAPRWVEVRVIATYLLIFQGGLAVGSVAWGAVAERFGDPLALRAAAALLVLSLPASLRWRLDLAERLNLAPSGHWPAADLPQDIDPRQGPVLVTVEYQIDPAQAADFALAMQPVNRLRRRDGATRWGLYVDPTDPARYLEVFLVDSWAEHLRQHERVTVADRAVEARAQAFHRGPAPPAVSHLTGVPSPTG